LVAEPAVADYYEAAAAAAPAATPKAIANWVTGDLFALLNASGSGIETSRVSPQALADLVEMVARAEINQSTARSVLAEMSLAGRSPQEIVAERGLRQISDGAQIASWVEQVLSAHPKQVADYLAGKETLARWLFGQVMRAAGGQANPQVIQQELERQLKSLKEQRAL
jgi:aspartyl-tRNA(Asn)/glutamyl-tRNA(Gln) amidotransferase subunit B